MDVRELLTSSIRMVQEIETSLLFEPTGSSTSPFASTMSSYGGSYGGGGQAYHDDSTLNAILSSSVDHVSAFVLLYLPPLPLAPLT